MWTVVSPPAVEPVTLAEAKAHLRVPIGDDDPLIARLIRAARRRCESLVDRSFVDTGWRLTLDGLPGTCRAGGSPQRRGEVPERYLAGAYGAIPLPVARVTAVTSVGYLDAQGLFVTLAPTAYALVPGDGAVVLPPYNSRWPTSRPYPGSVRVDFTAGYGAAASDVPETVQQAVLLTVGHLYEHREAVADFQAFAVPGTVRDLLAAEDWGSYP